GIHGNSKNEELLTTKSISKCGWPPGPNGSTPPFFFLYSTYSLEVSRYLSIRGKPTSSNRGLLRGPPFFQRYAEMAPSCSGLALSKCWSKPYPSLSLKT